LIGVIADIARTLYTLYSTATSRRNASRSWHVRRAKRRISTAHVDVKRQEWRFECADGLFVGVGCSVFWYDVAEVERVVREFELQAACCTAIARAPRPCVRRTLAVSQLGPAPAARGSHMARTQACASATSPAMAYGGKCGKGAPEVQENEDVASRWAEEHAARMCRFQSCSPEGRWGARRGAC
jgi:hypothetical protein